MGVGCLAWSAAGFGGGTAAPRQVAAPPLEQTAALPLQFDSPRVVPLFASPSAAPLHARRPAATVGPPPVVLRAALEAGIPPVAVDAYQRAAAAEAVAAPGCGLDWHLLAGIGFIESGHSHGGDGGNPHWDGTARPPIYGPTLSGAPYAAIADTDRGALDGDSTWDRAVGPMQFLPSTWRIYGTDGNHDGKADPQNIYDAAAAAGRYLCAVGTDLRTPEGVTAGVYAYNHSFTYVRAVLEATLVYAGHSWPGAAAALAQLPPETRTVHAGRHRAPILAPQPTTRPTATSSTTPQPTPRTAVPTTESATPQPTSSPDTVDAPSPSPSPAVVPLD